jgi:hypothetical protein
VLLDTHVFTDSHHSVTAGRGSTGSPSSSPRALTSTT